MNKINLPPSEKVASFDVDCQKTFTPICPNELPVPEGDQIVDELNRQAKYASFRIGSKDAHCVNSIWVANEIQPALSPLQHQNADLAWPAHAVPGTKGFELLDGLPAPIDYDFFIWKGVEPDLHPYGACYHDLKSTKSTGVIEFLISNKIEYVIVGGLATDYCVKNTVIQLLDAGFKVILNLAACRGVAEHTTKQAIIDLEVHGAIIAHQSSELVNG